MPRKPLTCRSTRPGIAIPDPTTGQSDRDDRPVLDLDIAPDERPVDDGCGNPELHPYSLRAPFEAASISLVASAALHGRA